MPIKAPLPLFEHMSGGLPLLITRAAFPSRLRGHSQEHKQVLQYSITVRIYNIAQPLPRLDPMLFV